MTQARFALLAVVAAGGAVGVGWAAGQVRPGPPPPAPPAAAAAHRGGGGGG